MTDEQLEKGLALKERIDTVRKSLELWERAERLDGIQLSVKDYPAGCLTVTYNGDYVNFDVLKVQTIDTIRKRLDELEKEYERL